MVVFFSDTIVDYKDPRVWILVCEIKILEIVKVMGRP